MSVTSINVDREHKLIWEKWINCVDEDKDEVVEKNEYFEHQEEYDQLLDEGEEQEKIFGGKHIQPTVLTQFGFFPIKMYCNPARHFHFWVAHTNFYITKNIKKTILGCPGVEVFDLFSPYRFRIAIGLAFDEQSVLSELDYILVKRPNNLIAITSQTAPIVNVNKDLTDKLEEIKKEVGAAKYWIVFIYPDNETFSYSTDEDVREFERVKKEFQEEHTRVGGVILSSDGQNI